MPRDNYLYCGSLAIISFVFLAFPYALYVMGISLVNDFALTILAAGVLIDIFTTKIGFNRGYGEYNVFYNAAKKKDKNNAFLIGILISSAIRGSLIFFFWNDTFILMVVAGISLVAPLWNSMLLSRHDKIPEKEEIVRQIGV